MSDADLLVRDVSVVDGTGSPAQPHQSVVVEGARIAWVGPAGQEPAFSRGRVVDGAGRTLLPGLINAHVHLCNDGAPDLITQVREDTLPVAALRAARSARMSLDSGVTTVRDCGSTDGIAVDVGRAIADGLVPGPRVQAAGRVITMTGGHGHFMGREADGPDALRRAVRAELKAGAAFIKVMATGGVLTPGVSPTQTALTVDELRAVADTAHDAGRRVTTHAIGGAGIRNALEAGIDSVEHGFHLDEETLETAVDRGTFLVPTLVALTSILDNAGPHGVPAWVVAKAEQELERSREMFRSAVASGMRIAAGTDAGTPFNHHADMARELALMVELGLTPLRALAAATAGSAENMDLLHDTGTLSVGKRADLLLVDGDPTRYIGDITRVVLVVAAGTVHRDETRPTPAGTHWPSAARTA